MLGQERCTRQGVSSGRVVLTVSSSVSCDTQIICHAEASVVTYTHDNSDLFPFLLPNGTLALEQEGLATSWTIYSLLKCRYKPATDTGIGEILNIWQLSHLHHPVYLQVSPPRTCISKDCINICVDALHYLINNGIITSALKIS